MSKLSEASFGRQIRDLGNGLIIRHARPSDAQALFEFNRIQQSDDGIILADGLGYAVMDHINGKHPALDARYYTIVEDTHTGAIASTLGYVPQTWSYAGLQLPVGQIEFVSTAPEYRRRGLVRAQIDIVHEWSAERGDMLQFITGIPWYYRQFGYEYALAYRSGAIGYFDQIPMLKPDQTEPYHFRAATNDDLPFIRTTMQRAWQRYLISSTLDEAYWRYDLTGKHLQSFVNDEKLIILDRAEKPCGLVFLARMAWEGVLAVTQYEVVEGHSWLAITPSVLRLVQQRGQEIRAIDQRSVFAYSFRANEGHPVLTVAARYLPRQASTWEAYIRMPDIRGFAHFIIPALEDRLVRSVASGHTGELKIHWYRDGMKMVFERGKILAIEPYQPDKPENGDAGFGNLTILKLLLCHNSLAELDAAYNDVFAHSNDVQVLLNALFPKRGSYVRVGL